MRIVKFVVTGVIGVSVNLGTLHFLAAGGLYYLYASMVAFFIATVVGFTLQKFWTFSDREGSTHIQFMQYTALTACNLGLNTLLVYLLVDFAHMHYLAAQFLGAAAVAAVSYVLYTLYIFKPVL